jgi:putative ABC transport system substrate-binding protein
MVHNFTRHGYVDGRTIVFERRAAQGKLDRLPGFIDELVASHVDVIITSSYPAALAAKEHAGNVPIVVTLSGDPVATGLVASLAHPGGNITGVPEIAGRALRQAIGGPERGRAERALCGGAVNADDFGMTLRYQAAEAEAKRSGMLIMPLGVRAPDDCDAAFSEMTKTPRMQS